MKLRKGDIVLLRAQVESFGDADTVYLSGWGLIDAALIERVVGHRLEPGDMVQGGKVLMLWPEENPTHVLVEPREGPPLPVPLTSPVAQRVEDEPERKVPLFPDPETFTPGATLDEILMSDDLPEAL